MKSQVVVIASYLASVVMVLMMLFYVVSILPFTAAYIKVRTTAVDIYQLIESRSNWTASELVEVLVKAGHYEYVKVSIKSYDILRNNTVVYSDTAVFAPVGVDFSNLLIDRYSYSILYSTGIYVQYIVEVGYK